MAAIIPVQIPFAVPGRKKGSKFYVEPQDARAQSLIEAGRCANCEEEREEYAGATLCNRCYGAARRQSLVASGCCGYCGKPRNRFNWLCDDCADKHREKQRLTSITRSWTRDVGDTGDG